MTTFMWLWGLTREGKCSKLSTETLRVEEMLVNRLNKNKLARLLLIWWGFEVQTAKRFQALVKNG